jgi:hypothetical protein
MATSRDEARSHNNRRSDRERSRSKTSRKIPRRHTPGSRLRSRSCKPFSQRPWRNVGSRTSRRRSRTDRNSPRSSHKCRRDTPRKDWDPTEHTERKRSCNILPAARLRQGNTLPRIPVDNPRRDRLRRRGEPQGPRSFGRRRCRRGIRYLPVRCSLNRTELRVRKWPRIRRPQRDASWSETYRVSQRRVEYVVGLHCVIVEREM